MAMLADEKMIQEYGAQLSSIFLADAFALPTFLPPSEQGEQGHGQFDPLDPTSEGAREVMNVLPKEKMAGAMGYLNNQWDALTFFSAPRFRSATI